METSNTKKGVDDYVSCFKKVVESGCGDFYTINDTSISPSCEACHSMWDYNAMNRLVTGDYTGYYR